MSRAKFIPPGGARAFSAKGTIRGKQFESVFWVFPNRSRTDYPSRCKCKKIHQVIEESMPYDLLRAAVKRRRDTGCLQLFVCNHDGKLLKASKVSA